MNLIPIQYYTTFYYQFILIITLFVLLGSKQQLESTTNLKGKNVLGVIVLFLLVLYMGLRPLNYRFGDMIIYDRMFQAYLNVGEAHYTKDVLFEFFLFMFSRFATSAVFFFFCALIYVGSLYFATKKMFKDYWFYGFFMLIISFSFWSYGTNGIRNGMASSLFLYGITRTRKTTVFAIIIASTFLHKSMFLPLGAYIVTLFYNKPKSFIYFWMLSVPLSLVLGGFFTSFFLGIGIIDEKEIAGYLGEFNQAAEGVELKVGFRWDFLLYSASGVFAGWFFIFKKKYEDKLYFHLFNIYLIVNAFWVLVIRANYSNRFAYLSWFMLGIVIIYPLLKAKFYENQHQVVARIIVVYFAFTYLMNVILSQ
ncbi:EpsG family protein [Flavobacterium sp.]|uniref:EpsG family protein n=1 Tax=Flavobacterium sp. TaxID=239 RepID=UPI003751F344